MRIYAFVGESGTGKSYRAQWIAHENGLEYIIDDGLLIRENRIAFGHSAKKEKSKIASVKRAIFDDDEYKEKMIKAIEKEKPEGILILGTSENMVQKIAEALQLPAIERIIRIEDVASENEIKKAQRMRKEQGKHVIPVPTMEIKEQFSGYFLNPLKIFKLMGRESVVSEKTIVRPAYSYMGEYTISEKVINTIIYNAGLKVRGIQRISKIRSTDNMFEGVKINIEITVFYGIPINIIMSELAQNVKDEIEKLTALNIVELNITTKAIFIA